MALPVLLYLSRLDLPEFRTPGNRSSPSPPPRAFPCPHPRKSLGTFSNPNHGRTLGVFPLLLLPLLILHPRILLLLGHQPPEIPVPVPSSASPSSHGGCEMWNEVPSARCWSHVLSGRAFGSLCLHLCSAITPAHSSEPRGRADAWNMCGKGLEKRWRSWNLSFPSAARPKTPQRGEVVESGNLLCEIFGGFWTRLPRIQALVPLPHPSSRRKRGTFRPWISPRRK